MSSLKPNQVEQLLKGINPSRVGKDGKGFAHLEAWDVRAHLIRIFGFCNWSQELVNLELIFEEQSERDGKSRWTVAYRATVQLTIHDRDGRPMCVYTEAAAGDASNYPSRADAHDMAIKTAESQAFKRCAVNLGDQFGLSLYNNGGTGSVVRAVLDQELLEKPTETQEPAAEPQVDAGVPQVIRQRNTRKNIVGEAVVSGS